MSTGISLEADRRAARLYVQGMRFVDSTFDRAGRFSLGRELDSHTPYLSIPVSSSLTDYEEYYALSEEEYAAFSGDRSAAAQFADRCRRRAHDDRLILAPGSNRGTPR